MSFRKSTSSSRPTPAKKLCDGGDTHFCYNMTILVGCTAQVTTRAGSRYEGIFVAYSSAQEVMLEAAHLITEGEEETVVITHHYDVLVIPTDKVLAVLFENVDLSYPTRDFQTDSGISGSSRSSIMGDKQLTPWDGPEGGACDDSDLDCTMTENGWQPQEMFRKNEEKYGIVSSYSHDLAGYTTQLDKTDPETFKKHEEQATLIAGEIEKNSFSLERNKLENGDDEEEAFAAVVRPRSSINIAGNSTTSNSSNEKYIPPSKRQHHHTLQPLVHNQPMNNNGVLQASNNAGCRKPINVTRHNFSSTTNNSYHQTQERRGYDSRRPNQYTIVGNNEVRRMDDANRTRVANKAVLERKGREDMGKVNKELMDFHTTFNLQPDVSNNRRVQTGAPKPSLNVPMALPSVSADNSANGRNLSQSLSSAAQLASKFNKDDISTLPPLMQDVSATTSQITVKDDSVSPISSNGPVLGSPEVSTSPQVSSQPKVPTSTCNDDQYPEPEMESTMKECDPSSKKFTFNPNAKEFNPSKGFPTRSAGTPPREPIVPPGIPQIAQASSGQPFVPHQQMPPTLVFAPQYQSSLQSSNSNMPTANNTPRHPGQRKGVLGLSQRSEIAPSLQMSTAGSPLLAPTTLQSTGQHTQFFSLPGAYSQVRIHPQSMVSLYSSEGNVGTQMHLPMHYLPHGAASPANQIVNQHSNTPTSNQSGSISAGQASGHGYGSTNVGHGTSHLGYPIVGLPVVGVSYQHSPYMNMISHTNVIPHVSHPGSGTILPHNQ